jgi:hypothetical protein
VTDNSLIKLGDLTKPATVLIEKISDAVGGIFKPYQIVRVAKAEAEANRIQAASQIEITDLQRRAMHRFLGEEAMKQSNIESITQDALPLLGEESKPEELEKDWIVNFFDKSRIVSDQDMQRLWARVLAGEANAPGAFSKRTVNVLSDLDKSDAELFSHLCGFSWLVATHIPLVFDLAADIYKAAGITFASLSHLESLGLVQFDNIAGFQLQQLPQHLAVAYFQRAVMLTLPAASGNSLPIGKVMFTRAGQELVPVAGAAPINEFFDFVNSRWVTLGLVVNPGA